MTKKQSAPAVPPLTLEQTHERIYKLLGRITELDDRLNQHSGNASKPPSTDGACSSPPLGKWRHQQGRLSAQAQALSAKRAKAVGARGRALLETLAGSR